VSGSRQITVTRDFRYEPDNCARALALLLTASVRKKGGPTTALDDRKGLRNAPANTSIR
jgi:hypothetical protein